MAKAIKKVAKKAVKKTAAKKTVTKKAPTKSVKKVAKRKTESKVITHTRLIPNVKTLAYGDTFVAELEGSDGISEKIEGVVLVFDKENIVFVTEESDVTDNYDDLEDNSFFQECDPDAVQDYFDELGMPKMFLQVTRDLPTQDLIDSMDYDEIISISIGKPANIPALPRLSTTHINGDRILYESGRIRVGWATISNRLVKIIASKLID